MNRNETGPGQTLPRTGGSIPGSEDKPAFTLRRRRPLPMPVLLAVPHAGRGYTDDLLGRLRQPDEASLRLEDRHVDLVGEAVARETGAALLVAHAPRAMIDLNRSPSDVDWDMIAGGTVSAVRSRLSAGRRARSGLGLVPRRLPGLGELWNRRLSHAELEERIAQVHRPYHAAIADTLEGMRDRWGAALLIDLHSMPPLGPKAGPGRAVDYVVGDRFGGSCGSALVTTALDHFDRGGLHAAHNRPYAGGYVLDRHGSPARGVHAMQLEICRATYLDRAMREPGRGLADVVATVASLVRRLAGELSSGSEEWRDAAE